MTTICNDKRVKTQMQENDPFKAQNTLKGVAIIAVLVNHYLGINVSGDISGFANTWIAVFFIVSGYGLFYSIERRFSGPGKNNLHEGVFFYFDRFMRIFPLLWLALLCQKMILGVTIPWWTMFGVHGTGHYWFIPALLQCYLLCPFIYLSARKSIGVTLISIFSLFVLVNYLIVGKFLPDNFAALLNFINANWRGVYLLHILLFSFGLSLAAYQKQCKSGWGYDQYIKNMYFFFGVGLILVFMIVVKYSQYFLFANMVITQNYSLLLIAVLCVFTLSNNVGNIFLGYLGKISYSLYLFHIPFFLGINRFGNFPLNSIKEFLFVVGLFPFFIFFCKSFEDLGKGLISQMRSLLKIA